VTWVVDSSVAVKWFVAEQDHQRALRILGVPDDRVAPDILIYEVCNIFWRKLRQGEVSRDQAEASIGELLRGDVAFWPGEDLALRAFEISQDLQHPVYDCFYIACAEASDGILVTADQRLLKQLHASRFGHLGCHVADV